MSSWIYAMMVARPPSETRRLDFGSITRAGFPLKSNNRKVFGETLETGILDLDRVSKSTSELEIELPSYYMVCSVKIEYTEPPVITFCGPSKGLEALSDELRERYVNALAAFASGNAFDLVIWIYDMPDGLEENILFEDNAVVISPRTWSGAITEIHELWSTDLSVEVEGHRVVSESRIGRFQRVSLETLKTRQG